ncbi:MAG: universal stress protein, partial [Phenylobacterium sp.]
MSFRTAPPRKFLVISDGSAEFAAALRFACRRARSTGGRIAILRVIPPAVFEHWSGVRGEIERQARAEAAEEMKAYAPLVLTETGGPPELLFVSADDTREALR